MVMRSQKQMLRKGQGPASSALRGTVILCFKPVGICVHAVIALATLTDALYVEQGPELLGCIALESVTQPLVT